VIGKDAPGVSTEEEPTARYWVLGAIVFDVVMIAFVALIVFTALDLRPGARLVPLGVGLPTLALLLLQLAVDVRGHAPVHRAGLSETNLARASVGEVLAAAREEEVDEVAITDVAQIRREVAFAVWAVAYAALGILTNFLLATPIAIAVILLPQFGPIKALLGAALTGLGIWLVFDLFLQVRF
jgi:hypothetical protein